MFERTEYEQTPCSKQARYLEFKWQERDSNPQPNWPVWLTCCCCHLYKHIVARQIYVLHVFIYAYICVYIYIYYMHIYAYAFIYA